MWNHIPNCIFDIFYCYKIELKIKVQCPYVFSCLKHKITFILLVNTSSQR